MTYKLQDVVLIIDSKNRGEDKSPIAPPQEPGSNSNSQVRTFNRFSMLIECGVLAVIGPCIIFADGMMWVAAATAVAIVCVVYGLLMILARKRVERRQTKRAGPSSDPFIEGGRKEKRSAVRRKGNPVAILVSDETGEVEPVEGLILDRSVNGLGIELCEEGDLDPGTILSIRPITSSSSAHWVQVTVMNCTRSGRSWRIGCQFVRTPDWSTMMRFG